MPKPPTDFVADLPPPPSDFMTSQKASWQNKKLTHPRRGENSFINKTYGGPPPPIRNKSMSALPEPPMTSQSDEEIYDDTEVIEEIYDDAETQEVYDDVEMTSQPPPMTSQSKVKSNICVAELIRKQGERNSVDKLPGLPNIFESI